MSIDIPGTEDFAELTAHRHATSISLYVPSVWSGASDSRSPIGIDTDLARTTLRSATHEALAELSEVGLDKADRESINNSIQALLDEPDLWASQARTIAVFVSPDLTRVFRVRNELPRHTAVGDRFDVGPLLRSTTFSHQGYVLAVTIGEVRLLSLESDASSHPVELSTLPDDAEETLDTSGPSGRFNRHRADGALGPKIEQRRYCSLVQNAVLDAIGRSSAPMVLAASADLEPAYREVNTYPGLLEKGIDANPSSLSLEELENRGRRIIGEHFAAELADWRETFGSLRAHGKASSQLTEVARAATAGLVDTLLFDLASHDEGSIDESGEILFADEPGPATYGLVDEIAARVLRTGGTLKAVRSDDLPDDSPVAATFRSNP